MTLLRQNWKEWEVKGVVGEKRVRQSDKLIILIFRRDTFRSRNGPWGVILGLKGEKPTFPYSTESKGIWSPRWGIYRLSLCVITIDQSRECWLHNQWTTEAYSVITDSVPLDLTHTIAGCHVYLFQMSIQCCMYRLHYNVYHTIQITHA